MKHSPRRHKLFMITGLIAVGIVAVAGCSSSKASNSAATQPSKVTLVVYSAQGYDHAMTAAFTKATGIPVKLALVQSSAGIGAVLGDKKVAVRYLDPVTLLPSAIGIDARAPAAERAEARSR